MIIKDTHLRNAKPKDRPYKIHDGSGLGLYCLVMPNGSRLWRIDYRYDGKRKTLSLGKYPEVSLEEARKQALECRKMVKNGIDPSEARRTEKNRNTSTFTAVAEEWYQIRRVSWSAKHAQKIRGHLENHIYPCFGGKYIGDITPEEVLSCVKKIQAEGKNETAHKVLQTISQICRYAIANGKLNFDPCYPLKGILPPLRYNHRPAPTTPEDLARILRLIWAYPNPVVGSALKVLAYTFQRPGEVRTMKWDDIDFDALEWRFTVSKTRTQHIVPLSRQVVAILKKLEPLTRPDSPFVFASYKTPRRPISDMATNAALKALGIDTRTEITSHGFRAAARTLLHERLGFPPDVIEHQLAHKVPDRLGTAYNRTRFLEQRKLMMQEWADYLDSIRTTTADA
ncbi:tyrosine-type recombinase/integrase [Thermodesulforhabdus norvegica]|uniref:Integrase n=1 Tax=Thermodesulforhabdus norvegica TaxID=39841 RepID=A0A1I4VKL9_9BACT|nr:integrase arm-type DNA-binding domain-containing protein [Thermodesulforhabdus norvegica]SFN01741.1 Integrase [Thermodesulforhabdus norvegica]